MADFFHRLSYSFGNEDWETEQKALRIQPNDRVMCITASGDRPLHLLLSECESIVSIDVNPIQNALLDLKCASLKSLSPEEYLAFMGLSPYEQRLELFNKIKDDLEENTALYWDKNKRSIKNGVIFEGMVEKWVVRFSKAFRFMRNKKVKQLFAFDDLEEQADFVTKKWDSTAWRTAFAVALHPSLTRLFIKDPGLYEHVDESIHVGTYLRTRICHSLKNHLAKSNSLLSLLFQGKVEKEGIPPYLTLEGAKTLQGRIEKLKWETIDLLSFLKKQKDNSFDCFSLSDVASYISKEEFMELCYEILRTARSGARFCIRQFMSCRQIPETIESHFTREPELEAELENSDKCFVYRFMVGKVKK